MSGDEWKSEFARDGFVLLRGAVSPDRVARARDAISRSLARDARAGRPPRKTHGNYCPELARDARLRALLDPLRARTARLFGERTHVPGWGAAIRRLLLGAVGHAVGERAQIALRFPDAAPSGDRRFGFHLDGYPTGKNGVPRGYLFRSTLLIGVYLTQVARPDRGNFVVWPGSHRRFARSSSGSSTRPGSSRNRAPRRSCGRSRPSMRETPSSSKWSPEMR